MTLEENGLPPGQYDLLIDSLKSNGCAIDGNKDLRIRIKLIKNTEWKEILKIIPNGSLIKSCLRIR